MTPHTAHWPRADVRTLAEIRAFVAAAIAEQGGDDDIAQRLTLAVDELCSNVVLHGYRGSAGYLQVSVARRGGFTVTVRDRAPLFDPTSIAEDRPNPIEAASPGGFGLGLVRSSVDSFEHTARNDGNEIRVTIGMEDDAC